MTEKELKTVASAYVRMVSTQVQEYAKENPNAFGPDRSSVQTIKTLSDNLVKEDYHLTATDCAIITTCLSFVVSSIKESLNHIENLYDTAVSLSEELLEFSKSLTD